MGLIMAEPDFPNWIRRDLWSLEEGLQLTLRIEPVHNVLGTLKHIKDKSSVANELSTRLDIGDRAICAGLLKPDAYFTTASWATQFRPYNLLDWVRSKGWEIPDELSLLLKSNAHEDAGNEAGSAPVETGPGPLGKLEPRLFFILGVIYALGFDAQKVPTGGKQTIKSICIKNLQLFTDSTFDSAWKVARDRDWVRMAEHDKFLGR